MLDHQDLVRTEGLRPVQVILQNDLGIFGNRNPGLLFKIADNGVLFALIFPLKDEEGIEAYLRVIEKGVAFDEVAIGRVLSLKRHQGFATQLLREALKVAKEQLHAPCVVLEAQCYCRSLYEKLGFEQISEEFLDEGIPHIKMRLEL